jgi:hypothetical protein
MHTDRYLANTNISGIWPESPSFSDVGMKEVPTRWKGVCMEAADFKKTDCNRSLLLVELPFLANA